MVRAPGAGGPRGGGAGARSARKATNDAGDAAPTVAVRSAGQPSGAAGPSAGARGHGRSQAALSQPVAALSASSASSATAAAAAAAAAAYVGGRTRDEWVPRSRPHAAPDAARGCGSEVRVGTGAAIGRPRAPRAGRVPARSRIAPADSGPGLVATHRPTARLER